MRELTGNEMTLVSGGSAPQTMDFGCFAASVYLGVSPFFGPAAVFGAAFGVVSACYNVSLRH